jgi:hypothetical protein
MDEELTHRVVTSYLKSASYMNPGTIVLYGKYKNHRGKIVAIGKDKWGNPTIEIEPIPKGRKKNKVMGLFKVWRADVKEKALAEQAKEEQAKEEQAKAEEAGATKLARLVMADLVEAGLDETRALLAEFEKAVQILDLDPEACEKARKTINEHFTFRLTKKGEPMPPALEAAYVPAVQLSEQAWSKIKIAVTKLPDAGRALFFSLLQNFSLAPAQRKKIEKIARDHDKGFKIRIPGSGAIADMKVLEVYQDLYKRCQGELKLAKDVIAKGKEHSEEGAGATKKRAGSFTVVNAGGFSSEIVDNVAEVMKKAEALAKSSGLGEVCYGDVQVTNTISSKKDSLAFYVASSDSFFVRANVKTDYDTVYVVLHELGHRYARKFLKNDPGVDRLYEILAGEEAGYATTARPKAGDLWKDPKRGGTYRVRQVERKGRDTYVVMENVDDPNVVGRIPLEGYLQTRNTDAPNYKGFVSAYAKNGGPHENFAEMFAFYCMGKLPVSQSVPFEALVFGGPEKETFRFARKVLARHLLESLVR